MDFTRFSEVKELTGRRNVDKMLNPWIDAGWRLIRSWSTGDNQHFLLGWDSVLGLAQKPDTGETSTLRRFQYFAA